MRAVAVAAVVSAIVAGCEAPPYAVEQCAVTAERREVSAADRKILGAAAGYPADATLRGRAAELRRSQRARRAAAWEIVERVLAPVALAESLPAGATAELPRWQTWYGRDDLYRLFLRLYDDLGPDGRAARARFPARAVDDAFGWNARAVEELPSWPADRWREYLDAIDTDARVAGVGGVGVVSFSPGAARHLLRSYPEMLACLDDGPPPELAAGPSSGERRVVREPVALARCERRTFGPFAVADGETLSAAVDGDGAGAVELSARTSRGEACRAIGDAPCEVAGPGIVSVSVAAGVDRFAGAVTVDYARAGAPAPGCVAGEFPIDAVTVKAAWRRAQFGLTLPIHRTTGEALDEILSPTPWEWEWEAGRGTWGAGDGQADPGADRIYTLQLRDGSAYRLAGLHIMSKELDRWVWITLWWSPDPDSDFGADRPAGIDGVWRHYKMCVVTSFDERDPDPGGGFGDAAPSLARALAAADWGEGGPTWCSNPYIERGAGNADTNCIGCHQHGGVDVTAEQILADEQAYPLRGRAQVRNNFPTDFSWAVTSADRIARMFADVVEYYETYE